MVSAKSVGGGRNYGKNFECLIDTALPSLDAELRKNPSTRYEVEARRSRWSYWRGLRSLALAEEGRPDS
jgi:hypothetical protein